MSTSYSFSSKTLNFIIAISLLLPLLGLAYSWFSKHQQSKLGTDWDIVVQGYDPRDLLRGHYIRYQYDWGQYTDKEFEGSNDIICVKGVAPKVREIIRYKSWREDVESLMCDSLIRKDKWNIDQSRNMTRDRLYIPQTAASDLEKKLRDNRLRGVVTIRIRGDGKLTPQSINFEPVSDNIER